MSIKQYWPITENDVYVQVFDEILREVDHSFFDTKLIASYRSLGVEERYLLTRMYIRAPKWVRIEDLEKYMSPDLLKTQVIPNLVRSGWLNATPALPDLISDVASLTELQNLAKSLGMKFASQSRTALAKQLVQLEKQQSFFNCGRVNTRIAEYLVIECYFLPTERRQLFFQLEQNFLFPVGPDAKLEIIFLTHMKKQAYLPYKYLSQRQRPIFASADAFRAYCQARELAIPLEEAVNGYDKAQQSHLVNLSFLDDITQCFANSVNHKYHHASYTLGRAIFNVSQLFMKLHRFREEYVWVQKYLDQTEHRGKRGVSLIRKLLLEIRFLGESKTKGESSWLVSAVNTFYDANEEVNEIERLDLQRKTPKLLASIKSTGLQSAIPFIRPPLSSASGSPSELKIPVFEIVAVPQNSGAAGPGMRVLYEDGVRVEELALAKYATPECGEFMGGHYEGSIMTTIFWRLFYDLFFKDPEQFRCAYQSYPLHLQAAIDQNQSAIAERLQNPLKYLQKTHKQLLAYGSPPPNVGSINWYIPVSAVEAIVTNLGPLLTPILLRLTTNYRKYASGFPDLTLWNSQTKRVKFVEVKSENDTVSDNQQLWMQYLQTNEVEVEIFKVTSLKRAAKRKRTGAAGKNN